MNSFVKYIRELVHRILEREKYYQVVNLRNFINGRVIRFSCVCTHILLEAQKTQSKNSHDM